MDGVMPQDEIETSDVEEPDTAPAPKKKKKDPLQAINDRIAKEIRAQADSFSQFIDILKPIWQTSVEMRVGGIMTDDVISSLSEPAGLNVSTLSSMESTVNPDWPLTKTKMALLYSQNPEIRATHRNKQYAPAVPIAAKALNDELGEDRASMGDAVQEVLADTINAAGIGAVEVGYAARFQTKRVPKAVALPMPDGSMKPTSEFSDAEIDDIIQQHEEAGLDFPTVDVQYPTDQQFYITRFSPSDLIAYRKFVGSNFDRSPFMGRRGTCSWSEGKAEFKLKESDKKDVLGEDKSDAENLNTDANKKGTEIESVVTYRKIYYWRYKYDPQEPHFSCIWKIVFVDGMGDKPVIHEPWKGQLYDEQSKNYIGNRKFPIRVLTLSYVSDYPIPPSDSEAGRPQTLDMRRSRTQFFENRNSSRPVRWFDSTRVDPEMQDLMRLGTWQGMIPVKGDGARIIGEIARASYPQENISFDQMTQTDLREVWQLGANQMGLSSGGDQTAAETNVVQSNFATRIGQERAMVTRFSRGIAQVMFGWMALYSDFPTLSAEEKQILLKTWDLKKVSHELVWTIRPDSTVLLDSETQIKRTLRLISYIGKSGRVNIDPLLAKVIELHGEDPAEIIIPPQEHEKPPSITLTIKAEDLQNPLVLAFLEKSGQAPSVEQVMAMKKLLQANGAFVDPSAPDQSQQPGMPPPGQPALPAGQAPKHLPPGPPGPPQGMGKVLARPHPGWQLEDRIAKRSRDAGEE